MADVQKIKALVDEKADKFVGVANQVWSTPELGFKEEKSAAALIAALESEGFKVTTGLAGIPTAFVGVWGEGHPAIGLLGEFDALPGLSQEAGNDVHTPVCDGGNGHGCGHNLLGAGSLAAAVAVKDYMIQNGIKGSVHFFGCPGEEFGCGKMFMARAGAFDGIDAAFTWHPSNLNSVWGVSSLANNSIYYKFKGRTSHAAASPHLGLSCNRTSPSPFFAPDCCHSSRFAPTGWRRAGPPPPNAKGPGTFRCRGPRRTLAAALCACGRYVDSSTGMGVSSVSSRFLSHT